MHVFLTPENSCLLGKLKRPFLNFLTLLVIFSDKYDPQLQERKRVARQMQNGRKVANRAHAKLMVRR